MRNATALSKRWGCEFGQRRSPAQRHGRVAPSPGVKRDDSILGAYYYPVPGVRLELGATSIGKHATVGGDQACFTGEAVGDGTGLLHTMLCQATQGWVAGPKHCPYWEAASPWRCQHFVDHPHCHRPLFSSTPLLRIAAVALCSFNLLVSAVAHPHSFLLCTACSSLSVH